MRILICGDRNWTDQATISQTLGDIRSSNYAKPIECVIEGEAAGADTMGRRAAEMMGIPVLKFPAQWKTYGRAAGPIRNQQMLDEGRPTLVLAFHDNLAASKGTADMIRRARKAGIEVHVYGQAL